MVPDLALVVRVEKGAVYRPAADSTRVAEEAIPGLLLAPKPEELRALVQTIAERLGRSLERSGLITRDSENAYLAFDPAEEAPIHALLGHSITYRIATGPREKHPHETDATGGFASSRRSRRRHNPFLDGTGRFGSEDGG